MVRPSYMVTSTPCTERSGLIRSLTFVMVSTSSATPRSEKNSAASGMITPCAQASALTVSSPSDGWQSIST